MATTVDEYGNIVDEYDYAQENIPDYIQGYEFDDVIELSDGTSLSIADIYSDPSRGLDKIKTVEDANSTIAGIATKFGQKIADGVKNLILKPDGTLNTSGLATAGIALYGLMGGNDKKYESAGYTKPIPTLTANRAQVPYAADPNRRPGEGGRQYFTDVQYAAPADTAAARTAATTAAQGIASRYVPKAAATPTANIIPISWNPPAQTTTTAASANSAASANPASGVAQLLPVPEAQGFKTMAAGGGLAAGGFVVPADVVAHFGNGSSSAGLALLAEKLGAKPIKGDGDGMSDSIPTHIDGKEKALVANDEAYIKPEMVARIGGGDVKKGSEKLYAMMEKIRKARTGNPEQGKQIDAKKFMPGGAAKFDEGGTVGGGLSSSLSPWAGEYVTGMLGKTQALANEAQKIYTGPLTAGASDLQSKAFSGIGALASAGYTPTTYSSGTFGAEQAQQYMNPYLSAALAPQLDEMRRQAGISRVADAGRMTQAGAFGGSRQAIMESEGNRNLLEKQTQAIGTGYQTAYDKAMGQFNTEQDRRLGAEKASEASRQYGAEYGLKSLGEMARLGETQRGIDAEGIAAEKQQFEEQRDYPAAMLKFQRDMLTGLPLTPQKSTESTTGINNLTGSIAGAGSVMDALRRLGLIT